jgi:hypothetical protein
MPGRAICDHVIVQGTVSGTWSADTVFVAGDLLVEDGSNLAISPGSTIIFNGIFNIRVDGSIQALGTQSDSILFTMADTAGFSIDTIPGGGWGGIRFDRNRMTNDSSIFQYCHFEFGKLVNADPVTGHGGAIYANDFDKIRISHCLFRDNFATYNGGAVYLDSASVVIRNSYFTRNRAGLSVAPWGYGGAVCSDNSSPEIYWNIFENNSSTGVGGALAVRFLDCNVYTNIFTGNYSALGGGFGFLHIPECTHRINTNLVAENASTFFGGGVANLNASPIYVNNTIVYNQSTYGGGFYCKDSVSPDFYNTIIWGNSAAVGSQGYLFEVYSQADFFNCDVQDGPELFGGSGGGPAFFGAYESCIDSYPDFLMTGDFPYALSDDSPCYDGGSPDTTGFLLPETDLAGNPRYSHAFVDIGAYEVVWVGMEAWDEGGLEIWPNPTAGKFRVRSSEFGVEVKRVELYSLTGTLLDKWNTINGTWNIELDISHLPDGIYLVLLFSKEEMFCNQIIKSSR